jgi:RNA polymerase sigma-70 factor, ECF subfamily
VVRARAHGQQNDAAHKETLLPRPIIKNEWQKNRYIIGVVMQYSQTASGVATDRPSSATTVSDEDLISQIAHGEKHAIRILVARHSTRVFRFLLRIVRNEAAAEDLLNEVFIDVWRHAGRFESRSRASTWMLAIARNKALSSLRQRSFDQLDDQLDVQDPSDDPETVMQKASRGAVLQECFKRLSATHCEVIDLVYCHEQSLDEVAKIIGARSSTVKTRLFYARKHLAELMSERGVEASYA